MAQVRRIIGYGTGLRRQLEVAGLTQEALAKAAGVSRQTIARAISRDEVSDRTAERIAAALGHPTFSPTAAAGAPPARSVTRMPGRARRQRRRSSQGTARTTPSTWVRASDIVAWAARRDAQDTLPEVVRRLVFATIKHATRIAFRGGEGVQLSGCDGVVVTDLPNAFVPHGTSYWELGTTPNAKQKAEDDYGKRTAEIAEVDRHASAFVFVTAQRWAGKDSWAAGRCAERAWREVIAYDADDLEAWLDAAPVVHLWLSHRLGTVPEGAIDLATASTVWSTATDPPLPAELVLAGREEIAARIREWLRQPARPLVVRAESREEAMAIVAATFQGLPDDQADATLARAAAVQEPAAWRQLIGSEEPLILLPMFDAGDLIPAAARAGHGVIAPLGESDPALEDVTQVPPVARRAAAEVLKRVGVESNRADELAALARRSMAALRRRLALSGAMQLPAWAQPANARTVLPALLAGAWSEAHPADREVIAALSRASYEEVRDRLVRWAHETDPPLRRRGDAWYLVSKQDAWTLLARFLTRDDLERFEAAALIVLGTTDPKFDLPADRRWMAGALGHSAPHSGLLRRGLTSTLAVMGARAASSGNDSNDPSSVAAKVVRELLTTANQDWRLWASLSPHLPDLAEASPDAFLTAAEHGLRGEKPILLELFTDSEDPLFAFSAHTGLLWALERLAWSGQYLGRAARVLAKLSARDPGGKLANRPTAGLAAIFRPWFPQTAASLDQRLGVLDMLRQREPEAAWALMESMLPQFHATGFYSARPEWWDWAPEGQPKVTRGEYAAAVRQVVKRMLDDAGAAGARWGAVIEALPMLSASDHAAVVARLQELDVDALTPEDRAAIWEHLRKLVADHRSFPDAAWAMPAEIVDRVDALRGQFEPSDPVSRYGWLFAHLTTLPEGLPLSHGDWETRQAAIETKRTEALRAVLASTGVAGVLAIADHAEQPDCVGRTAGQLPELEAQEDEILRVHLGAEDRKRAAFGWGYATARARKGGSEWVIGKLEGAARTWSPEQQAALLHLLDPRPDTWERASRAGAETERAYWRFLSPFGVSEPHTEEAARHLLAAGRPNAAVDLLALRDRRELQDPELAMEALAEALTSDLEYDPPSSGFAYELARLLDKLVDRSDVDQSRVAALEWRLLPAVDWHSRRPMALGHLLAQNAAFFVDVVKLVFRGEGEEPRELKDDERERAERGYDLLLHSWSTMPGERADRTIDEAALRKWIKEARSALAAAGRTAVGDHIIGQVLSRSPAERDGTCPSQAVRNVIEELESEHIEKGFVIGVLNSRGVTTRDPAAGGTPERGLAGQYEGLASAVADQWPRTASILRRIADSYRADAKHEDFAAALDEDLGA
ncbi:MAG: helix-turn-helix transcriptional regulator [Gemmatimonadetes bacterium]|nr:helix-turn-helix transcriptional regulator [Gemmatimonadota bacterium]